MWIMRYHEVKILHTVVPEGKGERQKALLKEWITENFPNLEKIQSFMKLIVAQKDLTQRHLIQDNLY